MPASTTRRATRPRTTASSATGGPSGPRRAAILGGNRIPFARANGKYAKASNQDMLTTALEGLVARFGLAGERIGEVAAGAVLKHSRDFNLTREAVLGSSLAPTTPGYDVQQACGTGLETTILVANKIALGQIESGIAGGVDSASDAPDRRERGPARGAAAGQRRPHAPWTGPRRSPRSARSPGPVGAAQRRAAHRALHGRPHGDHRQGVGHQPGGPGRAPLRSHQQLAAAYESGFFDDLVTPYLGVSRDTNLRPDTSLEKLASLKPVFGKGEGATMTAGNSTPLTDGASAVLLGSDAWAAEHGLTPLAYFVDAETAAVDYVHGDEGLLMAPAYAVPRLLARIGLTLQDFDLVEIHEAFASTVLTTAGRLAGRGVLPRPARSRRAARRHRPGPAERHRLVPRRRSPVRGDRRPDRRHPREAVAREGFRVARADLHLRRRWPGRRGVLEAA